MAAEGQRRRVFKFVDDVGVVRLASAERHRYPELPGHRPAKVEADGGSESTAPKARATNAMDLSFEGIGRGPRDFLTIPDEPSWEGCRG